MRIQRAAAEKVPAMSRHFQVFHAPITQSAHDAVTPMARAIAPVLVAKKQN
jgi:hypothetical protein